MGKAKSETPPSLVVRRVINAKIDRVFQAWTNPEMMKDWFYCGEGRAEVENDLRVGGSYRNEMITKPSMKEGSGCGAPADQTSHLHTGEYLEVVPPEKIVFTWNSHVVTNSRVTVELRELGDSTEVWITHDQLETEDLRNQHNMGWDGCLDNLEKYFG